MNSASRLMSPETIRRASTTTSLACSLCRTLCASAGETSVTMSISPSEPHTRSSASAGSMSLTNSTRPSRGPRSRFQ